MAGEEMDLTTADSASEPTYRGADRPWPPAEAVGQWTDVYFKRTRTIVERHGDVPVTYAVFMRRPVVFAPRLALDWLRSVAEARGFVPDVEVRYREGQWVGAGEPMMWISGPFAQLAELETLFLMKLGPCCVAAHNAFVMSAGLPRSAFLAMDARHCAGTEMADLMAYAASVGSERAKRKVGAIGFIGNATDATAHYFGQPQGFGTMPHALIGYAGSTVKAAELYHDTFPGEAMTVLVDYFGREVSDTLAVCRRFPDLAAAGKLSVRLDTPGGRFVEGLDPPQSYAVLERRAPDSIRGYRDETELRYLIGAGVSAAGLHWVRENLDQAGFDRVRIVASSGFSPAKCRVMADAQAPIDVVGTGSFLPEHWGETYATADIVAYNGVARVKMGREFLLKR
ncbi:nicotinate phosphoribosyltransferase [Nitrospirillum iridis]|uniref:Nicotinate phosphoribosyltransferase n=2 Tax=Nitrospirillum iridis TaxID=765888 RepID=A0A7X0B029_9PROT|nr:nicotinate phosphoribosyltransferase [Nitrospirillum iridis]